MITLLFGSNRLIGPDIPVVFRDNGKDIELFKYSLRDSDSKPMIDVEIRDAAGKLLGQVLKSTCLVYIGQDYEGKEQRVGNEVRRLTLTRKSANAVLFDLIFHSPTSVELNGVFHIKGYQHSIVATNQALTIGGLTFSQNTIVKRGVGIILTRNGFAI